MYAAMRSVVELSAVTAVPAETMTKTSEAMVMMSFQSSIMLLDSPWELKKNVHHGV